MKEINEERALLYGFLSRIYRKEADEDLLNKIKQLDYSQFDRNSDDDMEKGFLMLYDFSKKIDSSTLLDLARDYARTFIGAGMAAKEGSFPYESYYTSPDRLLMQDARDEVMLAYGTEMLKRSDDFKEHEDHVAFEFEFMAYLCEKAVEMINKNDQKDFKKYNDKQKDFFKKHINRWVVLFCDDVLKVSRSDFYKGAALITKGLLKGDKEYFEL